MDNKLNKSVANIIKQRRLFLGLSQEGLADLCGLDRTYISSVERGKRNLTLLTMEKIIAQLEINIPDFLKLVSKDLSNAGQ
jgi:transcriptional regulator with XRE-family HTH domain